jgi:hypothetical protein
MHYPDGMENSVDGKYPFGPADFKIWDHSGYRLRPTGGFTAFEPFGLWPATRAAVRKNESSRFAFFLTAKAVNRIDDLTVSNETIETRS